MLRGDVPCAHARGVPGIGVLEPGVAADIAVYRAHSGINGGSRYRGGKSLRQRERLCVGIRLKNAAIAGKAGVVGIGIAAFPRRVVEQAAPCPEDGCRRHLVGEAYARSPAILTIIRKSIQAGSAWANATKLDGAQVPVRVRICAIQTDVPHFATPLRGRNIDVVPQTQVDG